MAIPTIHMPPRARGRFVAAAVTAACCLLGGASPSLASDSEVGATGCKSSQDVVSRGESTAGTQHHIQWLTTLADRRAKWFPTKAYRHADYANWGFSTAKWRVETADATLYYAGTYGYCVS
jgi:hypothetical protein